MHTSAELLRELESVLPPVPRPIGSSLTFHPSNCLECESLRSELERYQDPLLPDEAIRWLSDELSLLSAQGLRWVLPSFLRKCLTQDPGHDAMETEFLIYSLRPDPEHEHDAVERLAHLKDSQLQLLERFLAWCAEHPHWSEYCPTDIAKARDFIGRVPGLRGAA